MKDSPNLDCLRALAVGLVLLSHVYDYFTGFAFDFSRGAREAVGRAGVAIFFVHTTLVLMMSLERHGPAFGPFMLRRIFRIYPLSVTAVLAMAVMLWIGGSPLGASELASNLLLVQTFTGHRSWPTPLWTLPYEVLMYLFLPSLYLFTRRSLSRMALAYLAALALAATIWTASMYPIFIGFIPCFLPGAVAFLLSKRIKPFLSPWVLFSVVGAGVALASWRQLGEFRDLPSFWALCLAVGLTIPLCRQIAWRPLTVGAGAVARYSYGIYLTHVIAMGMTLIGNGPWYWRVAAFVVMQTAMAVLAYRLIEAPGIKFGARLVRRLGAARTGAQPA